jgi:hypothetical protein
MVMPVFEWVSLVCVKQSLMHIKAKEGSTLMMTVQKNYFFDEQQKSS